MDEILKSLEDCKYEITEVKKGERIKNAPLPFTTSTLQQEAAKTLNFSTQIGDQTYRTTAFYIHTFI